MPQKKYFCFRIKNKGAALTAAPYLLLIKMAKFVHKRSKKLGLPPGTLIHIGEKKIEKAKISAIFYNPNEFLEKEFSKPEDSYILKGKKGVLWINIDGLQEIEIIEKIGNIFNIHPLVLEDIVNTGQRPKIEDYDNFSFIVLKMIYENKNELMAEQISIILGENFILSFQEKEGDVFNNVRARIKNGKGRIRNMGADYLAYSLIDSIVDNYFLILEKLGEKIEYLEEELVSNPTKNILQDIHKLKSELLFLRKSIWPLREVIGYMYRGETPLISKNILVYFRDIYDHTIQIIDTLETFRDMVAAMIDIYLSSISNKMNEIMKMLTIIATIFIPLTYIAGIYGMNFKYMPELEWRWGYYAILAIMALIGIIMLGYFRKRKWL